MSQGVSDTQTKKNDAQAQENEQQINKLIEELTGKKLLSPIQSTLLSTQSQNQASSNSNELQQNENEAAQTIQMIQQPSKILEKKATLRTFSPKLSYKSQKSRKSTRQSFQIYNEDISANRFFHLVQQNEYEKLRVAETVCALVALISVVTSAISQDIVFTDTNLNKDGWD